MTPSPQRPRRRRRRLVHKLVLVCLLGGASVPTQGCAATFAAFAAVMKVVNAIGMIGGGAMTLYQMFAPKPKPAPAPGATRTATGNTPVAKTSVFSGNRPPEVTRPTAAKNARAPTRKIVSAKGVRQQATVRRSFEKET